MFFHLVVENPRSQILAMLLTEKACYPQKSKPTAHPVHMWLYVIPWVARTWCFHSIGDSWLLLTRQWTGMDASGTAVEWIGVKAGQGPRYRNPSSIRHSESLSLLSSPQPPPHTLIFRHMEFLCYQNSSVSGNKEWGWGQGSNGYPWAHLQKQCLFRPSWGKEGLIVAHITFGIPWLHLWFKGAIHSSTLFPVCPHAFPFSCFSLVSWITLTQTPASA